VLAQGYYVSLGERDPEIAAAWRVKTAGLETENRAYQAG
jgi:hypothetical protein